MLINEAGWVAFGFIIFCIIAWRYGAKPFVDVLEARANDVKEKLLELEEGNKKVLINYKDVEIFCGLSISSEVNLHNIMRNIKGIKNIEKIM